MSDADAPPILDDAACQRALAVLVDVGTSLAKELQKPSDDTGLAARAASFDRVALAVRRSIILSRHIANAPARPADDPANAPIRAETVRIERRKRIIRAVEETINTKAEPAEAGSLRVELLERIDSPDFEADLTHRAPGELIAELCRDLGLANVPGFTHYPRRTPDDIAILCAQAAAPAGSGLPRWLAIAPDDAPAPSPAQSPVPSPVKSPPPVTSSA